MAAVALVAALLTGCSTPDCACCKATTASTGAAAAKPAAAAQSLFDGKTPLAL